MLGMIPACFGQNRVLDFDGANDYVSLNSVATSLAGSTQHTIEFWMKTDSLNTPNGQCMFAININATTDLNGLLLTVQDKPGFTGVLVVHDSGTGAHLGNIEIADNACHHIAYVRNGSTARTYVDGQLDQTFNVSDNIQANDRVSIGQDFDGITPTSQHFNGDIDDFRIWTVSRTEAEISANMNTQLTGAEPNLLVLYNFEQGTAGGNNTAIPNVTNLVSGGVNGTFNGFALTGATSNFVLSACCSAASDSQFTQAANTITANTFWDGKMYIPDNTIVTVDGAVLDITTADVVFGQCAGIDFINGAILRANNSVFRPCNIEDTWRGLNFFGNNTLGHQVNENTFKNAEIALRFSGEDSTSHVNSNTFSNCNEGIHVNGILYTGSIVGNTFVTNNAFPQFTGCYSTTNPTDVINIHIVSDNFELGEAEPVIISQNSMVMSNTLNNLNVTGVDIFNGVATISDNTMTNMTDGVVIQQPQGTINVESNEFSLNGSYSTIGTTTAQISVLNANRPFVFISNNEFTNDSDNPSFTRSAIYTISSQNSSIHHNSIDGFNIGVEVVESSGLTISENLMTGVDQAGIQFQQSGAIENIITCNDITMKMNEGIGISMSNSGSRTQISSNCIKDSRTGIQVSGSGNIPVIRNNFIYNYQNGIINNGHTGNIGTSIDPGMNTLWSNNNLSADISSISTTLNIANNFGVFNISGSVITTQNNPYHSTTSCATQIFDYNNQGNLNTNYSCENRVELNQKFIGNSGGIVLPANEKLASYIQQNDDDYRTIMAAMSVNGVDENYILQLIDHSELSDDERLRIDYYINKYKGNYTAALMNLSNMEITEFSKLETIQLKMIHQVELTEQDQETLMALSSLDHNDNDAIYNLAVTLSKALTNSGVYRYSFPALEMLTVDRSEIKTIVEDEISLIAFPSPVEDVVTLQILNGTPEKGQVIQVYNIYGQPVMKQALQFSSGQIKLDMGTLAPGTYLIALNSDSGSMAMCKVIKK